MNKTIKNLSIIIAAIFFTGIITFANQAQALSKTKHVTVGDVILMFEIPDRSCFVDQSSNIQKRLHDSLQSQVESSGRKKLLIAFVDCSKLTRFAEEQDVSKITDKIGYINWLNPEIGYTYGGTRKQFINMITNKFSNANRDDFKTSDNSVNTLVRHTYKTDEKTIDELSVMGYTIIKRVPLEIKIKDATENFSTKEDGYNKLNSFINYQIKLNE